MDGLRLDACDLTVHAGGREILAGVSLSVRPGELVAVMGPSGSGKSTLLHALNGYRWASAGQVRINGVDLYGHFTTLRSAIGFVPQDDIVHESLSVEKVLHYAALLRLPEGTAESALKERIDTVLKRLGLADRRRVRVSRLSGGQRKRVSLGVELLTSPPLLFLDEPTSGLDPALEADMMGLFRELADDGRTVLVTTHVTESLRLPDLVAFLVEGRLVYAGPTAEALDYFGADSFAGIFTRLPEQSATAWATEFLRSRHYSKFVAARLSTPPPPMPAELAAPMPPAAEGEAAPSVDERLAELKRRIGEGK